MIEAAAETVPEETSLDVLRLEVQAHGCPEEAVDVRISCSLEHQTVPAAIPGASSIPQTEAATLFLYPESLSWIHLLAN